MIPVPDLLHLEPKDERDPLLQELLELAFLGHNETARISDALEGAALEPTTWDASLFADDIFLREYVEDWTPLEIAEKRYYAHRGFLSRVLSHPSVSLETIRFRQGILRELEADDSVRERTEGLYVNLVYLLDLIKSAHTLRTVDNTPHRLRMLAQARSVIDRMADDFATCESGLRRIHEAGTAIRETEEYGILSDLLAFEDELASIRLDLKMGADGRIKRLEIRELQEDRQNRFHLRPLRRWIEMLRVYWRGYGIGGRELANRVIVEAYSKIAPQLGRLMFVLGDLEFFLVSRSFAAACRDRGLDVCLATVTDGGALRLRKLFNPLLLRQERPPTPCDIEANADSSTTIVTGPNSGGKTRLLQALAFAQTLAQSGMYVPAASASVPIVDGLYASVVQSDGADELEGRLGRELVRIRSLFENVPPRSMILLDELCSGTNPSEAAEIVLNVLRLLARLTPRAFVTTHFLDLGRQLEQDGAGLELSFLQVLMEGETSTYRFVPGVAQTSMAVATAAAWA